MNSPEKLKASLNLSHVVLSISFLITAVSHFYEFQLLSLVFSLVSLVAAISLLIDWSKILNLIHEESNEESNERIKSYLNMSDETLPLEQYLKTWIANHPITILISIGYL